MKEIFESIFISFKERFQNRFIGTFIIAFLILNWKRELALFFLKDMKYADAISVLAMDDWYLCCLMVRSVLYSLIYLMVSPWLSYLIQCVQSAPINRYKRKAIHDSMEVLIEKEALEKKKRKVSELEHSNLIAEESRSDEIKFDRLKGAYNEQSLIRLFDALRDHKGFSVDGVRQLSSYIIECDVIDNVFSDDVLEKKKIESVRKLKELHDFIVRNASFTPGGQSWLTFKANVYSELDKLSEEVLKFYRAFRSHQFKK